MALSRPVTALDNERFTVQSVMLHYAVPVVLVRVAGLCGAAWGRGEGWTRRGLRATHMSGSECRGSQSEPACGVAKEGERQCLGPSRGVGSRLCLCCSQQAGFLITNALRFIFSAPGVTSWQYTLLQLQARTTLSSLSCFPPTRRAGSSPSTLAVPPSLQPRGPLTLQLKNTSFQLGAGTQACNPGTLGGHGGQIMRSRDRDHPGQYGETPSLLRI